MTWESYNLDREAQRLVLAYRNKEGVIGQSHKMRTTIAYGLERFWGEQLRLLARNDRRDREKGEYWRDTWKSFVKIMKKAGIKLPEEDTTSNNTNTVEEIAAQLWALSIEDQRISIAVLTQFCDSLVWWTQRYKQSGGTDECE
jgi:hypothetical protein